jgi:hypothetical protein
MATREFSSEQMRRLREGEAHEAEQDPTTAIACILSVDPSGGGLVSAIGIVGLYVYQRGNGPLYYEIAHAVAVSVDIKTYLFAIADLIHAHAAALYAAHGRQPVVYIESIDRVSYTGHLFKFMHPDAPFAVRETVFFDKVAKKARFEVVKNAINEGRLRIRSDLKRFIRPKSWDNYRSGITNLDGRGDVDWEFKGGTATNDNVRLLEEMQRLPVLDSPKKDKQMDDVVLAMVNGIFSASDVTQHAGV